MREAALFNWIGRDGKRVGNSTELFILAQTLPRFQRRLLTGKTHLGQKLSLLVPRCCMQKIRSIFKYKGKSRGSVTVKYGY